MIMWIQQLMSCGIRMIMKNPFDYAAPGRGRRVPAGARSLPSPPVTEVNGTGRHAVKLGGQSHEGAVDEQAAPGGQLMSLRPGGQTQTTGAAAFGAEHQCSFWDAG